MTTVEKTVQDYYTSQSLDDDKVQRIIMLGKRRYRQKIFYRVAAVLILMISTLLGTNLYNDNSLKSSTFAEIYKNHNKGESPLFYSNSYDEMSQNLDKLTFAVVPSDQLDQYDLIGGLYCSVQGVKAAQLKYLTPANDTATLFICEDEGVLENLKSSSVERDGIKVSYWKENGLFYGLAETLQ